MSDKGTVGTLTIYFSDGESLQEVASLLSARLSSQTEMKQALHPELYGWDYFIPGTKTWRAESTVLQLVDADSSLRKKYLYDLEYAYLNDTLLNFVFEGPSGAQYTSQGYLSGWEIGGGFEDGYQGSFSVQGVTVLELSQVFPWDDDADVLLLTPASIGASGGVLTTWTDLSGEGNSLGSTYGSWQVPGVGEEARIGRYVYPIAAFDMGDVNTRVNRHSADVETPMAPVQASDSYLWFVFKTGDGEGGDLFNVVNAGGTSNFLISLDGAGIISVTPNGQATDILSSSEGVDDNEWHLLEYFGDVTNGDIFLWIDGVLVDSDIEWDDQQNFASGSDYFLSVFTAYGKASTHAHPARIALAKWTAGMPSAGRIAEIRAYLRDYWGLNLP